MKTLFIETKYNGKININKKEIAKLPAKVGLVTTVQFVDRIDDIKKIINKKIITAKGKQIHTAQILGCDVSAAEKIKDKVDAFLFVGDGSFHPLALAELGKNIFVFDVFKNKIEKIDSKEIDKYNRRKKGMYLKFLDSDIVGILISNKIGQYYNVKKLNKIKQKYKNKKFYTFMFDNLNYNELENFPFIECWVNTACPRIVDDYGRINKPIINIKEL